MYFFPKPNLSVKESWNYDDKVFTPLKSGLLLFLKKGLSIFFSLVWLSNRFLTFSNVFIDCEKELWGTKEFVWAENAEFLLCFAL